MQTPELCANDQRFVSALRFARARVHVPRCWLIVRAEISKITRISERDIAKQYKTLISLIPENPKDRTTPESLVVSALHHFFSSLSLRVLIKRQSRIINLLPHKPEFHVIIACKNVAHEAEQFVEGRTPSNARSRIRFADLVCSNSCSCGDLDGVQENRIAQHGQGCR